VFEKSLVNCSGNLFPNNLTGALVLADTEEHRFGKENERMLESMDRSIAPETMITVMPSAAVATTVVCISMIWKLSGAKNVAGRRMAKSETTKISRQNVSGGSPDPANLHPVQDCLLRAWTSHYSTKTRGISRYAGAEGAYKPTRKKHRETIGRNYQISQSGDDQ
jgi:hypothetical protein